VPVGKPAVRTDRRPSFFCAARAVRPRLERGKKTHARAARLPRSATPWGDPPPLWIARARTPWFGPGPRPELFVCSGGGTQGRVRAAGGTWGATGGVAATAPPGRTAARAVAVRPTGGRCTPPRAWWPLPLCRRPPPQCPRLPLHRCLVGNGSRRRWACRTTVPAKHGVLCCARGGAPREPA